jgi:hypothetical protein
LRRYKNYKRRSHYNGGVIINKAPSYEAESCIRDEKIHAWSAGQRLQKVDRLMLLDGFPMANIIGRSHFSSLHQDPGMTCNLMMTVIAGDVRNPV